VFTRRQIVKLLIPLMVEQFLSGLMGIADTMMVTSIGETAVSAVALVDSINTLMLQLLAALAAGGVIVCSQFLGREDVRRANDAARQVMLVSVLLGASVAAFCVVLRGPLLRLIFGTVEWSVMDQAMSYFLITAISYPFMAAKQTAAAILRSGGRSAPQMVVTAIANVINIVGKAILIFSCGLGVVGAALATLFSRIFSAVVLLVILRNPKLVISIRDYFMIRPNREVIGMVLRVGVPAGIENSMFQFGKLIVQSTVSTLGTAAMAAQAMTHILNLVECMPSQAICIGLLTVAGRCMGAGRVDEAKKHTKQFCIISEIILVAMGVLIVSFTPMITRLSGMTPESAALTMELIVIITIVKALIWVPSFTLPSCLRAAGDVRFSAIVSVVSMWVFRVGGGLVLCRGFGVGLIGLWIAWFADWFFRVVLYVWRFCSGRWETKRVIR
jgi:putative MATE family efflux protein